MKICFLMYPWDKVIPKNSNLRLTHECLKRNHNATITKPNDLGIRNSVTTANSEIFILAPKDSPTLNAFRKNHQRHKQRGFSELLKFWQDGNDFVPLLVGKTSTGFYNIIVEMIKRIIVEKPQYITQNFENHQTYFNNQLFDYILSGLK